MDKLGRRQNGRFRLRIHRIRGSRLGSESPSDSWGKWSLRNGLDAPCSCSGSNRESVMNSYLKEAHPVKAKYNQSADEPSRLGGLEKTQGIRENSHQTASSGPHPPTHLSRKKHSSTSPTSARLPSSQNRRIARPQATFHPMDGFPT